MDRNQLVPHAGEGNALTSASGYPPLDRIPTYAPPSFASTVLLRLSKGLHYLLFAVILWLRVPPLVLFDIIARLAIVGATASGLFWLVSSKPQPMLAQMALVCLAANLACHLLLWLYDSLLLWLSPNRL